MFELPSTYTAQETSRLSRYCPALFLMIKVEGTRKRNKQ